MKSLIKSALILAFSVLLAASPGYALDQVNVPAGKTGIGNNTTVVAQSGSIVYARRGANVQYWPGSNLVPASQAVNLPDCSKATLKVDGNNKELLVSSGSACATGDSAVIALSGSTVIYDDGVPLIRRPVVRRQR